MWLFHVGPPSASSKVDASDAACHGSVSHCVAGVLVEGRACFMFDLCGVFVYPSRLLIVLTVLGAISFRR